MKYLLIALITVCSLSSYGQHHPGFFNRESKTVITYDTVKVGIMWADTTINKSGALIGYEAQKITKVYLADCNKCWPTTTVESTYLDERKKRLPKTYIIFHTKEMQ